MRIIAAGGLVLSLCGAAACSTAQAQTKAPVQLIPLDPPAPPARVVVPALPEPDPAPVPAPAAAAMRTVTPPRPDRAEPPATPPAHTADAPPPPMVPQTLQTTADIAAAEKAIHDVLLKAQTDLNKVDFRALNANGQAQYNSAKGFIRQAEDALKVKNYVYATQLADKAATMAGLLLKG